MIVSEGSNEDELDDGDGDEESMDEFGELDAWFFTATGDNDEVDDEEISDDVEITSSLGCWSFCVNSIGLLLNLGGWLLESGEKTAGRIFTLDELSEMSKLLGK